MLLLLVWFQGSTDRIVPYIGRWKGKSITKRTGVYGATIAEADTVVVLDIDEEGQLTQVCYTPCYLSKLKVLV